MSPPIRWDPERLDAIIDQALVDRGAVLGVGSTVGGSLTQALRSAIYRRLRSRGIEGFTLMIQRSKVLMLWNPSPAVASEPITQENRDEQ